MQYMKIKEERVFNGGLKIYEASFENDDRTIFNRTKISQPDCVAVLAFNADRGVFVFTTQYRYPTDGRDNHLIEIASNSVEFEETA